MHGSGFLRFGFRVYGLEVHDLASWLVYVALAEGLGLRVTTLTDLPAPNTRKKSWSQARFLSFWCTLRNICPQLSPRPLLNLKSLN